MCGIIYAHDFNGRPVNKYVKRQFKSQRNRGVEGFGLFDGQYLNLVKTPREQKIMAWLKKYPSNMLMFHHRMPTSTINVKRAAHPFSTRDHFGDNQYILIHNGWVVNDETLYLNHRYDLKIEYQSKLIDGTFNDSEALLWDVALYLEGHQNKLKAQGAIAFVCMKLHKGKLADLYFARNSGSPLKMFRAKNEGLVLSSEGKGELIQLNQLYRFNYETHKLYKSHLVIPEYTYQAPVKNYSHNYTPWPKNSEPSMGFHFTPDGHTMEYERDSKSQLYLPVKENKDLEETDVEFTPKELDKLIFSYLLQSDGNFEKAYYLMEAEYMDNWERLELDYYNEDLYISTLLLEKALEKIMADPEYKNEKSISSAWSDVWNKAKNQPATA